MLCRYLKYSSDFGVSFCNFRMVIRHVWAILSWYIEKVSFLTESYPNQCQNYMRFMTKCQMFRHFRKSSNHQKWSKNVEKRCVIKLRHSFHFRTLNEVLTTGRSASKKYFRIFFIISSESLRIQISTFMYSQ